MQALNQTKNLVKGINMSRLRTLLFMAVYYLLVFWFGLTGAISLLLPYHIRRPYIISWNSLVMFFADLIMGVKVEVRGRENIPQRPCVVLANHQSEYETFVLQTLFQPLSTILKRELLNLPFFGWGLRALQPIAIDRSNPKKALKQVQQLGLEKLNSGCHVLVFPEGTRMPPGEVKKFAKSGANLAIAAGVPIVPVAHNCGEHWASGNRTKIAGTIVFTIGEPINTEGESGKKQDAKILTEQAQVWVEQQLRSTVAVEYAPTFNS